MLNELYELKEKLCKELKHYNSEELTANNLSVIDKLSHAVKNIDKIIEKYEEEEGGSYGYGTYEGSYRGGGRSNRGSYNNGNSYARGRGRNAKRDSMGRYSREGGSYEGYSRNSDIASELREMMMDAPDEQTRMEYQRVINKLEQM